jgi:basic amino acid/polyamine antiporter, APA family
MAPDKKRLNPSLGLRDALVLDLGAIIGAGVFVVIGILAGLAGPALVVSILIAAAVAMLTAQSFIQLAKWQPAEGGTYEYARRLIAPSVGFLAGWIWMISNLFGGAAVALSFAGYVAHLLPRISAKLVAALLCAALTALNYVGIRRSVRLNTVMVLVTILVLLIFSAVGAVHFNPAHFKPFFISWTGIFVGANYIFFAFTGFARVAVVAEEISEPRRVVPRAIGLALAISAALYVAVGLAALGLVPARLLAESSSPLAHAISSVGNPAFAYVVSVGAMFATAGVLLTAILGVSRMAYAMARDGDLPAALSRLHPRYDTPHIAIVLVGILTTALVFAGELARVVAVSTFASLFYYALTNVAAFRLQTGNRAVPALGTIACVVMLLIVPPRALAIGLACLAAGLLYEVLRRPGRGTGSHRRKPYPPSPARPGQ